MGQPVIQEITLRNFLSFGPETPPFEMKPLNVLIGPNASGKSNFLNALAICTVLPTDGLERVISDGGGAEEWIWKGAGTSGSATLELVVDWNGPEDGIFRPPLRHRFEFRSKENRVELVAESISDTIVIDPRGIPWQHYVYKNGIARVAMTSPAATKEVEVHLNKSILAQLKYPDRSLAPNRLDATYRGIRMYRDWSIGATSTVRYFQRSDLPTNPLEEDLSNLALFVNHLSDNPSVKRNLLNYLRDLYPEFEDIRTPVKGGRIQISFQERGVTIPATRLSDGTLRYLCLLTILLNPEPPPVVCIEEPELGLHPDLLPKIADLMVEASERMQLVVTTHSDIIIDALTEHPECVVVCEKGEGGTEMKRLDGEKLKGWLEDYRLGALWMKGQIGGTRW
ncbi:MAG: AAA family ATPase [Phycisphaerales bacterium]|nr:AAA family ATPase [Phycisphaerales bacterium]